MQTKNKPLTNPKALPVDPSGACSAVYAWKLGATREVPISLNTAPSIAQPHDGAMAKPITAMKPAMPPRAIVCTRPNNPAARWRFAALVVYLGWIV